MKPISRTFFSIFFIFAFLFNDVVITVQVRSREKVVFDLLNERQDAKNQNETVDGKYRLKSETKNQAATETNRAITNTKTRELILLSLAAIGLLIAIGAAIGKSYFDSKREKEDEMFKKQVLTEKVQQQIEKEKQNEFFLEYCQLFQTLGKLVETNILLGKFHVHETSQSVAELKTKTATTETTALLSKVDPIVLQFTNEEKSFTRQTYANCYNSFHWRTSIPDVGGISHDMKFDETDFSNIRQVFITAKTQVKEAVHTSPSDYLSLADLVGQGKEAYSTLSELEKTARENKLAEINSFNPINIETPANTFIGDAKLGGQIAGGAWSLYKKIVELDEIKDKAELENLGHARKGLTYITCGWEMLENLFKTSNTVVGMVGGASLNVPFTGLVTLTLKLVSAISNYKVAYDQWSSDKTDLKVLAKDLKFWDMMDSICDLLQELANDMILISPLTAGVSAVLGISLKVVFGLIGVFSAWMRLRKSRQIHAQIIAGLEHVTGVQQKNTKVMSERLTKEYCLTVNQILRQYLDHEFKRFEEDLVYKRNLAEEQYENDLYGPKANPGLSSYTQKVADWNSNIESANAQVLDIVCADSNENCLTSFNALIANAIIPFGREGYRRYAQPSLEASMKAVRSGPINSALAVLQGSEKTNSIEFSLMTNGYVPAYQSPSYNIFVCRRCLDTSLLVESLTFGNTDDKYPVSGKTHIQDTIHVKNLANNVETVQFMNAVLGNSDPTKENNDYGIVHGASTPELKTLPKTNSFDFFSLVIYSGKAFPNPKSYPLLGAISTSGKYFYLFGASSSSETDVRGQLCKTGTTSCNFRIVRVDQGQASRVVENAHSSSVRVTTEEYDHSAHINEKGYMYAFSTNPENNQVYIDAGWTAINSENIAFESVNFKLYRKKVHDVSSILTREYEINPKNIWSGMKTLEKASSRAILQLTKKVHCETCKVAFANTVYGLTFFFSFITFFKNSFVLGNFEFDGFDPCSTSETKWDTTYSAAVQKSFNEQKCRAEEKTLQDRTKQAKKKARKDHICGVAQEFWTKTAKIFVSGATTLACDSLEEVCT